MDLVSHVTPWLWLLVGAGLLWLFQKAKAFTGVFVLLVFPGTFFHEACHYLVAKALNGQPASFTIIPKRQGATLLLGAVRVAHPTWYNRFFIGLSPLVLLWVAQLLFTRIQFSALSLTSFLGMYLVANLAYGAIPSRQDWRMAAKSPVGWALLVLAIWMLGQGAR